VTPRPQPVDRKVIDRILHLGGLVDTASEPVFVVGCLRSGAGALAQALRAATGWPGIVDGSFGSVMQRMLDQVDWHYGTLDPKYLSDRAGNLIANTDRQSVERSVTGFFVAHLARSTPPGPSVAHGLEAVRRAPMVRSCRRLLHLFPKARFIYVGRRVVELVSSCLRRAPDVPIQHWCWVWQDSLHAWGELREELGTRRLEIHQHTMALDPTGTAQQIASFLHLDEATTSRLADDLRTHRRHQTQVASEHRFIGLDETPWKPWQRDLVRNVAGSMMTGAGYSFDPGTGTSPLHLFFPADASVVETGGPDGDAGFSTDADGALILRAGTAAHPASVRYPRVPLSGHRRFTAEVASPAGGGPLHFHLRIDHSDGRTSVVQQRCTVQPNERSAFDVTFPPLSGLHDIVIAVTTEGPGRPSGTWRSASLA
jgi:hypothetical protein